MNREKMGEDVAEIFGRLTELFNQIAETISNLSETISGVMNEVETALYCIPPREHYAPCFDMPFSCANVRSEKLWRKSRASFRPSRRRI